MGGECVWAQPDRPQVWGRKWHHSTQPGPLGRWPLGIADRVHGLRQPQPSIGPASSSKLALHLRKRAFGSGHLPTKRDLSVPSPTSQGPGRDIVNLLCRMELRRHPTSLSENPPPLTRAPMPSLKKSAAEERFLLSELRRGLAGHQPCPQQRNSKKLASWVPSCHPTILQESYRSGWPVLWLPWAIVEEALPWATHKTHSHS